MGSPNNHNVLNIAILGHKHIPSREGGIEVVVDELAVRMAKLGYNVTVYNRGGHHVAGAEFEIDELNEYQGVHIKKVPTINYRGLAAASSSFFGCIKAAFGPYNIVHIHAEGPAFFCWLPKMMHKKVIVTVHGLDWKRDKWGKFASWYIRQGEIQAVKHADHIIVLSDNIKNYFWTTYHRKVDFIPNGVNRPEILEAKEITKKWGLNKGSFILYVGRIVPEKGLEYLLQAWKNIKTDKKLVIAGGTSDTDEYVNRMKSISDGRVLFTNFVSGRVLKELYSNAYLYCLPSNLEGMPLTVLEAMSYGNCCLTSDIEECIEVIEDKGVTFKKGNIEDLRTTLQALLDNPEIVERYKKDTQDFICDKYSWDDVVEKTLRLYRN